MAVYLTDLKSSDWYNSIVGLPEGTNEMNRDLLLLWKQNEDFDALFMTEIGRNSTSPVSLGQRSAMTSDNEGVRNLFNKDN